MFLNAATSCKKRNGKKRKKKHQRRKWKNTQGPKVPDEQGSPPFPTPSPHMVYRPATSTPSGEPHLTKLEEGMEDYECLVPLGLKL